MTSTSCRGSTAFYLAIFLNAVVDLGHKITIQNTIFKTYDGNEQVFLTAIVNGLIILPYILFFLPAGQCANKFSKPAVMKTCAWFSVFLTFLIMVFYWQGYFWLAFSATFLMAIQSTFYSPAKLGLLKQYFGQQNLPRSNALAQASVIVGILLGTLIFSYGFEFFYGSDARMFSGITIYPNRGELTSSNAEIIGMMFPLGFVLWLTAIVELVAVYRIPNNPGQQSSMFSGSFENIESAAVSTTNEEYLQGRTLARLIKQPKFLLPALGLSLFWMIGQGALAIFPAYAKQYVGISNTAVVQSILASSAIGILIGAVFVAPLVRKIGRLKLSRFGLATMLAGVLLIGFGQTTLFFVALYIFIGIASACLIIPLNAYLQANASSANLGSVVACSNVFQNLAMLTLLLATIMAAFWGIGARELLFTIALVGLIIGALVFIGLSRLKKSAN